MKLDMIWDEKWLNATVTLPKIEEQMKSLIGTKVSVHAKANGKGKIEIEYYSPDDLERIYELLMTIQHN